MLCFSTAHRIGSGCVKLLQQKEVHRKTSHRTGLSLGCVVARNGLGWEGPSGSWGGCALNNALFFEELKREAR